MEAIGTRGLVCFVATAAIAGLMGSGADASVRLARASCPDIKPGAFVKKGFADVTVSGAVRCTQADEILQALALTGPTKTPMLGFTCTLKGSAVSCVDGKESIKARKT